MKWKWTLLLTMLLLLPGSSLAGDEGMDALRDELTGLTDAIAAQMKLLAIYGRLDRPEDLAATRRRIGELLEAQRRVLDRISEAVGGSPGVRAPLRAVPRRDLPFAVPTAKPKPGPAIPAGSQVRLALDWLARHQARDGFWDSDLNGGHALYDPGVTGLALLAFLGAGETHKQGQAQGTVKAGLKYLKQVQDPEGCFGPRASNHFIYNHAIATLAMSEAYGLSGSPLFAQPAQLGADFLLRCQNPYLAWRYGVRAGDNDTSVTGWAVAALRSAKAVGLRVDEGAFAGALAWLDKVTEPEFGRVGYTARGTGPARPQASLDRFPPDKSEALTAEGILIRVLAGEEPAKSDSVRKAASLCLRTLPSWDEAAGSIDMYYWYWGTLALFQVGGEAWRTWSGALRPALVAHQRTDGEARGSWDPVGVWGADGGRVYSTALLTLCLEVLDRYAKAGGATRPR